jgi:hypothetical protein
MGKMLEKNPLDGNSSRPGTRFCDAYGLYEITIF